MEYVEQDGKLFVYIRGQGQEATTMVQVMGNSPQEHQKACMQIISEYRNTYLCSTSIEEEYIKPKSDKVLEINKQLENLQSFNMVEQVMVPRIVRDIVIPTLPTQLPYEEFFAMLTASRKLYSTPDPAVYDDIFSSFVTGCGVKGVVTALKKIMQDTICDEIPGGVAMVAQETLMVALELNTKFFKRVPFPEWDPQKLLAMKFPYQRGTGVLHFEVDSRKNMPRTKDDLWFFTVSEVIKIVNILKKKITQHTQLTQKTVTAFIPTPVINPSLKIEIKKKGDDPDKARMFFPSETMQYLIEKVLFEVPHKDIEGKLPYAAGYRFGSGGTEIFIHYIHGTDENYEKGEADCGGKDVRFTARRLGRSMMMFQMYYEGTEEQQKLIDALFDWAMEHTMSHNLFFAGKMRMTVGMLLSGQYNTTYANTLDVLFLWFCFLVYMIKDPIERMLIIQRRLVVCVVGGDDFVTSVHTAIKKKYGISFHSFSAFLENKCGQLIKPGSACVTRNVLSTIDRSTGNVVESNPFMFHKNCFVDIGGHYVPYRMSKDVLSKAMLATSDQTWLKYSVKLVGLALSTWGTNEVAYNVIRAMFRTVVRSKSITKNDLNNAIDQDDLLRDKIRYRLGDMSWDEGYVMRIMEDRLFMFYRTRGIDAKGNNLRTQEEEHFFEQRREFRPRHQCQY